MRGFYISDANGGLSDADLMEGTQVGQQYKSGVVERKQWGDCDRFRMGVGSCSAHVPSVNVSNGSKGVLMIPSRRSCTPRFVKSSTWPLFML